MPPLPNLAEPLDLHARQRPTHPALIAGDREWSWAEAALRVRQVAQALAAEGVGRGDFIGLGLRDTPAHVFALFALMRLGAVLVPLDWRWSAAETESLAAHVSLRFRLAEPDAAEVPGPARIAVSDAWLAAAESLPGEAPLVRAPDLPMILSLSSGTTGRPTGPLATHGMMLARIENQLAALTFNQHDRHLLATPLYFGGGRAFAITHFVIGATLILNPPPYAPEALAEAAGRHHATTGFLVPTLLRRLLALPDTALAPMRGLRLLISSGAPLHPPERAEIARRITPGFMEYFASTEGGGISVLAPADMAHHPDSVGRAAFMVAIEVVDPETHAPLPPDTEGPIRYRGPGVAEGFHNEPEKTAEAFRDGWFYPGDVGRIDAEGYVTLLGRAKNVIIRGGVNIYPAEIERALEGHPDVTEAAVIGRPDPEMGEQLRAVVVAARPVDPEALRAWCRERLAPYKVPREVVFVPALPRNAGGKVLLAEVRARWGGAQATAENLSG